jgi:hypothetical protein
MIHMKEQYVVDTKGIQTAVLLDINYYHELLAKLEELESIKSFDSAKNSGDESLSFEQAISEIEKHRK